MKRKLTKRNKQFLSSRYSKYHGGKYSFQINYVYEDILRSSNYKIVFDWGYSTAYTYKIFDEALIADWGE
jgi:hypothetical protein